ncbi:amino acid permease [Fulvivirgaceae bacterium PWU4]|uniref:Amino acid permease n=1 Tax=Chryseosolibacter histidini TaxID=2782349 RepID=A0AAP2DL38_9BACT|nr:amino acid permease [Chryseosolibacter histidini]MBT1698358.1 amino acid permease [Chryseosolibacter histidini]
MANIWLKKNIHQLVDEASDNGKGLKRTIGTLGLISLGIGAIIGAGLFTSTAEAIANHTGPAVSISFIIAGIGCALAGLCYAEFASMIPIAGSAYTYAYATMGECIAWIIGWDLVLEYGVASAKVATSWSEYLNRLLNNVFHFQIPYELSHSPFQASADGVQGIINLPALLIILLLSLVLIRGVKGSSLVNSIIVIIKVGIVLLFIGFGWSYINPANYDPYIPANTTGVSGELGWTGLLAGAGVVFFAFIGFDAVSTAAQEAKNPQRDMPKGILLSLSICVVLYILFAHVLAGVANYTEFRTVGQEASITYVIDTYMKGYGWLSTLVTVAILAGFSSVILVMLMGQSRVFFSMSKDGLVPGIFSQLHARFKTPWKSNLLFFVFVGIIAAFVPASIISDMTVIGTLFAFVLVCLGIIVLRKTDPSIPRPFRTPWVPVVPILGILVCTGLMYSLGPANWLRLIIWLAIGAVIYVFYGIKNSRLQKGTVKKQLQQY